MKQQMMWWQWHQLDYMQIICTLLQFREITTPTPHHSIFNRLDALPAAQNRFQAMKADIRQHKLSAKIFPFQKHQL